MRKRKHIEFWWEDFFQMFTYKSSISWKGYVRIDIRKIISEN
jgi:hypothetical protein